MKITKTKTRTGEFGAPVSTELSAIVERMRSEDIKEQADRIATMTRNCTSIRRPKCCP